MWNRLFRRSEKPEPADDGGFDTRALVAELPNVAADAAPAQPIGAPPTTSSADGRGDAGTPGAETDATTDGEVSSGDPLLHLALKPKIIDAICTVFDPEIPVNIYELGLIYGVEIDSSNVVHIDMTLTSPACPSAQQLPAEVAYKVKAIEGVKDASVNIVWEPPWSMDKMSEAARMHLGMF